MKPGKLSIIREGNDESVQKLIFYCDRVIESKVMVNEVKF